MMAGNERCGGNKAVKLLENWKKKKDLYLEKWKALDERYGNGGWPAKGVKTEFNYLGEKFVIEPETIGLDPCDPWDQGFLEYLQKDIGKDLEEIGATDIYHTGYLD